MGSVTTRSAVGAPAGQSCATCGTGLHGAETFCHVCGAETGLKPSRVRAPASWGAVRSRVGAPLAPVHPLSLVALVLGILAYGPLPLVGALGAVYVGVRARRAIRAADGAVRGTGFATVGLVLGAFQLLLGVLVVIALLMGLSAAAFFAFLR